MTKQQAAWMIAAGAGAAAVARALVRRARYFDLAGKTVLVTGGSRGFGFLLAKEFLARGARVAITARDKAELARASDKLLGDRADLLAIACDVADPTEVESLVQEVADAFGPVDVLVNNAGVIQSGPMEEMTIADYEEAMKTHFWAPLYLTNAVLPEMRQRRSGRIVNVSSIGGLISVPHLLPYCASKFALTGLSEGLRAELMKDGIFVTTVCPGLIRTGSARNAFFKGRNRNEYAWFSLGDSLPLTSTSAAHGARQVVDACARGDAELVLSVQARAAALFHGLFPGVTADLFALVERALPAPGGIGTRRATGAESESAVSESPLTILSRKAALANNEM